jgi:hypothetical protein
MGRLQAFISTRRLIAGVLVLGLGALITWEVRYVLSSGGETIPEAAVPEFNAERHFLPQPAMTEIPVKTVHEAWNAFGPDELVLGVTVGAESRAYPLNAFEDDWSHKILNDTVGGRPIAASFCDNCHNGIIYDRVLDGRTLTFGVDGRIWKGSMVMYDEETQSRWSHITGVAKRGPLMGKALVALPSTMTDWQTWRSQHPEGTVVTLGRRHQEFVRAYYKDLKDYVIGIANGKEAKAWTFDSLERSPVLNDEWEGGPVVVFFESKSITAQLFSRVLDAQTLKFECVDGKVIDVETRSTWDPSSGIGKTGRFLGRKLLPMAGAMICTRAAWERHHPGGR